MYDRSVQTDLNQNREAMDMMRASMLMANNPAMPTNPIAAMYFFDEIGKTINWKSVKRAFLRVFGKESSLIDLRDEVEGTLGVQLPVSDDSLPSLIDEVRRFQWLEAERAGRDIWREKDPRNPQAGALREWFRLHFGAWYLANRKLKRSAA